MSDAYNMDAYVNAVRIMRDHVMASDLEAWDKSGLSFEILQGLGKKNCFNEVLIEGTGSSDDKDPQHFPNLLDQYIGHLPVTAEEAANQCLAVLTEFKEWREIKLKDEGVNPATNKRYAIGKEAVTLAVESLGFGISARGQLTKPHARVAQIPAAQGATV